MIQSVQIQNFKSVVDLTLELGTFNVLIGANGCGKSNILEAIAFGAAASADKLDHEFFGSRGIRMTNPEFMYSAFPKIGSKDIININFNTENKLFLFELKNQGTKRKGWIDLNTELNEIVRYDIIPLGYEKRRDIKIEKLAQENSRIALIVEGLKKSNKADNGSISALFIKEVFSKPLFHWAIASYIVFSPEQSSLRKFEDTNQIYPLGVKGEGLFQYLKELSSDTDPNSKETWNSIKECLLLLDWYEDFNLPKNLMSNEFALSIKDKYLNEHLQYFDQRSANEGFLFLLFYATLFISKDTPQFFAIDNIDTSFNPKLCMQVTKTLAALAKKHGKQVIVTTQNPAILDGLDLEDDNQRLFVVRRNEEGHTKAKRIAHNAERTMKLSEVWTNGFIGGLPDNF